MRRRSAILTVLLAAALAFTTMPLAGAGGAARARTPLWQVRAVLPIRDRTVEAATCPSATTCVAVGSYANLGTGGAWWTSDGGTTWHDAAMPGGLPPLTAVACGSSTACEAVGLQPFSPTFDLLGSTDGGAHWTLQRTVASGTTDDPQLGCESASDCLMLASALSGSILQLTTTDGGATWARSTPAAPVAYLVSALSCVPGACEVLGDTQAFVPYAARSTTNGASWAAQSLPSMRTGWETWVHLSCTAAGTCAAIPEGADPSGVLTTSNGGTTWTASPIGSASNGETGVACGGTSTCIVYGSAASASGWVERSTDGGSTWYAVSTPASTEVVWDAACGSPTSCVLFATATGNIDQTLDLSTTTTTATAAFDDGPTLWNLACATRVRCTAVGGMPTASGMLASVFTAEAPFTRWTASAPGGTLGSLVSVACPSSTACLAVGDRSQASSFGGGLEFLPIAARSLDGGATWRPLPFAISSRDAANYGGSSELACPTPTTCIDDAGAETFRTTNLGLTWSHVGLPPRTVLLSISCVTRVICVGVGVDDRKGAVLRSVDAGRSWTVQTLSVPGVRVGPLTVTCLRPSGCVLGGYVDAVNTAAMATSSDAGRTWARAAVPPWVAEVFGLACLRISLCLAVGSSDRAMNEVVLRSVDGGRSWVHIASPAATAFPFDVMCGPLTCWALGWTWSGATVLATGGSS